MPFLLIFGVLLLAVYGTFGGFIPAGAVLLIGLPISLARDVGNRSIYSFRNDRIVLEDRSFKKEIFIEQIIDASPIDRMAARNYIKGRIAARNLGKKEQRRMLKDLIRYCTVDIGMISITGGLGRSLIDRLPGSRYDLVLLRLRGGEDLILSPKYMQDMVDAITRLIASRSHE